ncbi:hypothetical protein [Phaeocystidibacter luteus]|uniref:HdeD family acid-resistance protein n=1 Tax=Phaeocystidibacter luteus TaxID=911197 RepID=A0A6N6RLH6_9FLAO|nr:hypothetical protein [Phaeocystidibacter luteus]KAB2814411.1 hypothetical protein F8C67_01365 [Phaeocystidibacter luteus]
MFKQFARYWWLLTVFGALLIGLGGMMLVNDEFGLAELLRYLAFVLVGMGVFTALVNVALAKTNSSDWRWYAVAAAELIMGIVILMNGEWAEAKFIMMIAIWSLIMGLYLLYVGLKESSRSVVVLLSGVVSVIFAGLILFDSVDDSQLHLLVGLYAILLGVYLGNGSLKIRGYNQKVQAEAPSKPAEQSDNAQVSTEKDA